MLGVPATTGLEEVLIGKSMSSILFAWGACFAIAIFYNRDLPGLGDRLGTAWAQSLLLLVLNLGLCFAGCTAAGSTSDFLQRRGE